MISHFSPLFLSILISVFAYLLGSIPFGLLLTSWAGQGDIRTIGSGNIGATNVLRTGNKKIAAATLLLDAVKGAVAIWLVKMFFPHQQEYLAALAAFFAVIGHCFPIWLKFKGGKGVATGIGSFWALALPLGICCTVIWLLGIKITKISSLGALLAFLSAPFLALLFLKGGIGTPYALSIDAIALLSWIRHHENISRLLQGTEPRITRGKEK